MTTFLQTDFDTPTFANNGLALFDFENWSGPGNNIPNEYTQNVTGWSALEEVDEGSGSPPSLETSNPIVGSQSLRYNNSGVDQTRHYSTGRVHKPGQYYISFWMRLVTDNSGSDVLVPFRIVGNKGWKNFIGLTIEDSKISAYVRTDSRATYGPPPVEVGKLYFVETWTNQEYSYVRVNNDNVSLGDSNQRMDRADLQIQLGFNIDVVMDNFLFSASPVGLELANDSDWLYNGGTPRSTSEIRARYNM